MSAAKDLVSELGPKALSYFWKTGFKKALTIGMGLGTSLIASTAVTDILIPYFLSRMDPEYQHENSLLMELFAPVAGVAIFFICLFCLFLVDLSERRATERKRIEAKKATLDENRSKAASLAGQLKQLAQQFATLDEKAPGFMNEEQLEARDFAMEIDSILPASIRRDLVFAAVKQWKVDAAPHPDPIFGISSEQLLEFAERLAICLGEDNET